MKKTKQNQRWEAGDLFTIPLLDETKLLGQVLAAEPAVLNSVSCALFDQRFRNDASPSPEANRLFSVVITTRDLLDSGVWKIIGAAPIAIPRDRFPFETLRKEGFVGAKVIGSRNIVEFANAYCRLAPWDDWADPHYLDQLLISADKKPCDLTYKNSKST